MSLFCTRLSPVGTTPDWGLTGGDPKRAPRQIAHTQSAETSYFRVLYDVQPNDPLTTFAAASLLAAAALFACLIPALRASRVDPTISLRYE